jgi:hypothetical protein
VGSWFQLIPVLSTNTIPASAARSSIGRQPKQARRTHLETISYELVHG